MLNVFKEPNLEFTMDEIMGKVSKVISSFLSHLNFIKFTYQGNSSTEDMIWLPKETSTLTLKLVPTHLSKKRNTCNLDFQWR